MIGLEALYMNRDERDELMLVGILILFLGGCASQQPVKSTLSGREAAETYLIEECL
jgi:hypothetical protein